MQGPLLTIFDKPFEMTRRSPNDPGFWRGLLNGLIFLAVLPLILIALLLSIPYSHFRRALIRRSERKFTEQMKKAGRFMPWDEFECAVDGGSGTAIIESLGIHGPVRLWWTPEDVPALSPHEFQRGAEFASLDVKNAPFFRWCCARYTDPASGGALLVDVPKGKLRAFQERLKAARLVEICTARWIHRHGVLPTS
jgi:hypothetical protein